MKDRSIFQARVSGVLLLSLFVVKNGAQTTSSSEGFTCTDTFSWCPSQRALCDEEKSLKNFCMKTCNTCPDESEMCKKAQCSQTCEISDDGITAVCGCRRGYELGEDQRLCQDINECERNSTLCTDEGRTPICINHEGSYTCTTCRALRGLNSYYKSNICCKRNARTFSQCGSSGTNGRRTIGGVNPVVSRWPWVAYIKTTDRFCTGTLVHRRWIVTTASCLRKSTPRALTVVMGAFNTSGQAEGLHAQTFSVHSIVIHPDFDFPNNDIALLRLRTSAIFGSSVGTICLPNGHQPNIGDTCYATNFEPNDKTATFSAQLQEVDLPIIDTSVCEAASGSASISVDPVQHMCAGHVPGGRRTCPGNSGGPLMCQRCNSCDWYIAGVMSFRRSCTLSARFQSYTRLTQVETWIAQTIRTSVKQSACVRPEWHAWGGWTDCTASCGGGKMSRIRFCINGNNGDPDCIGDTTQTQNCNVQDCEGEIVLASWSTWTESDCSVTCGEGRIRKVRTCLNGNIGDLGCEIAEDVSHVPCNMVCEPTWGSYGRWSECSVSCGGGIRRATRSCNTFGVPGARCIGNDFRTEDCQTQECPRWSDYSEWDTCSATCGTGIQSRSRSCLYGSIGDIGCHVGGPEEARNCSVTHCEKWDDFAPYGPCTKTCGGGVQFAVRQCIGGNPGDPGCQGNATRRQRCMETDCPVWTNWGSCSRTCGHGKQERYRGEEKAERACNDVTCAPVWSAYEEWSSCTVTCGGGMRTRTRTCNTHGAAGVSCKGSATRKQSCQRNKCPRWTSYTGWSRCTRRCGGGTQTSRRRCRYGNVGDVGCQGLALRTRECNTRACRHWTRFQFFGRCSVTCGGGVQVSDRRCVNGNIGDPGCRGPSRRTRKCNTRVCPTWSEFGPYSSCNASCGLSFQTAIRRCLHGQIGQNGCKGSENNVRLCTRPSCDYWEEFGNFSECDVSCGGGVQIRSRTCKGGVAGTGNCIGNSTETRSCNNQTCIVPLCCDTKNVMKDATCWDFVRQQYCTLFAEYMNQNCRRSCCQFHNRIHCVDKFSSCRHFPNSCGSSRFDESCPLTCNACPEDTTCD